MPDIAKKSPGIEITIETPDGARVVMKAASDAEAEDLKARVTAEGSRILSEDIGSAV